MDINVIGLGYIGLPTALILAANGNHITGTDCNTKLIGELKAGLVNIAECGLMDLYHAAMERGIVFTDKYIEADMYIVAVPTPYMKKDKKIDAAFVIEAVKDILNVCKKGSILVIESTVSPGTINTFIRPVLEDRGLICGRDIHLAHAPERIIPGNILKELKNNSRTIGADSLEIANCVKEVYQTFCQGTIVLSDIKTAEMTKVVENTYRDINIAFANELTKICRMAELDVYKIIEIANMHPRVNILSPGPGVGGHCISVDPWFLVGDYPGLANIILAARKINDSMPEYVLERVSEIMSQCGIEDCSKVGFYGLTYKENVDDIRESPTLQLLDCMRRHLAHGAKVYDPFVSRQVVKNQFYDFKEFVDSVELIVIMVGHKEIIQQQHLLQDKIILDTRNVIKDMETFKL